MSETEPEREWVQEAPSPVGATYVELSAERPLRRGERIAHLFNLNQTRPYVLQRLTGRTYWFQAEHYATTFYVGDEGVLLFDPLHQRSDRILQAIGEVTDLPVRTIVYSHDHHDHIGGVDVVLRAMGERGVSPRIVASAATAAKQAWRRTGLPPATEALAWPEGGFAFEGLHVDLRGFERAAHCDDHGLFLLREERVLHAADHTNPDELPFWKFSANENFLYFESNLRQSERLDWVFENGGHGNVGAKDERAFYYQYIADMTDAVRYAMERFAFRDGLKGVRNLNNHTAYHVSWTDLCARSAVESLRPRYGAYYGYEAGAWSNAEQILWALFAYSR